MRKPAVIAFVSVAVLGGVTALAVWQYRRIGRARVEHESHTVAEAVRKVAKLTTVEMSLSNWQMRTEDRPLFKVLPISCRKTMAVFYRGKIAAGFDLDPAKGQGPGLGLHADLERRRLRVQLPPPRVLYAEVPPPELVVADGSLCNAVTADDYAQLHREARAAIEREAITAGIHRRAEAQARELFDTVARSFGWELELHVGAPALSVSAR